MFSNGKQWEEVNIYLEVGSAALRLKVASLLEVAPAWNRREVRYKVR